MKINHESMLTEPIDRLNDAFFKYVLASPEHKHITIAFLNAVLGHLKIDGEEPIVIEDIEFLDREMTQPSRKSKGARFDVLARASDGRIFHIEVQNVKEKFFTKRSFCYVAHDCVMQLERGEGYDTLKPVIYIGLLNFTLSPERKPEQWYSLHRIMDVKTHEVSFHEAEFHMIELPLLRRYLAEAGEKPNDALEELLCYFGDIGGDDLMEELAERNQVIEDLQALERLFQQDPLIVRNYLLDRADEIYWQREWERQKLEAREEAREVGLAEGRARGREIGLAEGREAGFAEGRAEAKAETRQESARNLRLQGILTDEQIAQALNMSIAEVKAL